MEPIDNQDMSSPEETCVVAQPECPEESEQKAPHELSVEVELNSDDCSICFDEFSQANPASLTSCGHQFHYQCILQWQERSNCCPMCWTPFGLDGEEVPTVARNPSSTSQYYTTNIMRPAQTSSAPDDFVLHDMDITDQLAELLRRMHMANASSSRQGPRQFSASTSSLGVTDSTDSDIFSGDSRPESLGPREVRSRSSDTHFQNQTASTRRGSPRPSHPSTLSRLRDALQRSSRHFGRRDRPARSEASSSSPSTSPAVSPSRPSIHSNTTRIPTTPPLAATPAPPMTPNSRVNSSRSDAKARVSQSPGLSRTPHASSSKFGAKRPVLSRGENSQQQHHNGAV